MDKQWHIMYRDEFSCIVSAESLEDVLDKVAETPYAYQWECIGDLYPEYLSNADDEYEDEYEDE